MNKIQTGKHFILCCITVGLLTAFSLEIPDTTWYLDLLGGSVRGLVFCVAWYWAQASAPSTPSP